MLIPACLPQRSTLGGGWDRTPAQYQKGHRPDWLANQTTLAGRLSVSVLGGRETWRTRTPGLRTSLILQSGADLGKWIGPRGPLRILIFFLCFAKVSASEKGPEKWKDKQIEGGNDDQIVQGRFVCDLLIAPDAAALKVDATLETMLVLLGGDPKVGVGPKGWSPSVVFVPAPTEPIGFLGLR